MFSGEGPVGPTSEKGPPESGPRQNWGQTTRKGTSLRGLGNPLGVGKLTTLEYRSGLDMYTGDPGGIDNETNGGPEKPQDRRRVNHPGVALIKRRNSDNETGVRSWGADGPDASNTDPWTGKDAET